jgi:hypothetical protein
VRCALWSALVLLAFFAADAMLFRTGWYGELLEPDSSAGQLESHLYWVENARAPRVPQVLVVGDSRIAEGFSARMAGAAVGQSLYFWNFGVAGTPARVWYYALRDLDPDRRRFAAIVIALDQYSDEDGIENPEDRIIDQNYLVMRLGLGDCPDFAASFSSMEYRHRVLAGCLFRGTMLRGDVQAFLRGPEGRRKHAEDWLGNGLNYINAYGGKVENVSGLSVDFSSRTIHYPDGLSDRTRFEIKNSVLPEPVPQTGALTRYRQRWLGGIIDLYKDSPTRIVFLQLPHSPLPRPESTVPATFIASTSRMPRVNVFPKDLFADLERPELFGDGLHLNREGRPAFTTRIAERVRSILAESPGGTR